MIIKVLEFVKQSETPESFITDRGTSFTANVFKEFCNQHGIKVKLNSSHHAQANGQVERLNQTIGPASMNRD